MKRLTLSLILSASALSASACPHAIIYDQNTSTEAGIAAIAKELKKHSDHIYRVTPRPSPREIEWIDTELESGIPKRVGKVLFSKVYSQDLVTRSANELSINLTYLTENPKSPYMWSKVLDIYLMHNLGDHLGRLIQNGDIQKKDAQLAEQATNSSAFLVNRCTSTAGAINRYILTPMLSK